MPQKRRARWIRRALAGLYLARRKAQARRYIYAVASPSLTAGVVSGRSFLRWGAAALLVLLVHCGLYLVANARPEPKLEPAAPAAIMIDMSAETVAPSAQEESIAERTDRVERDLEKPVEQQQELTEEPVETVETIDPEETLSAEPAEIAAEEMLPDAAAVEMQELDQDVEVPLPLRRPHREEPPPEEKPLQKKAASPPKKTAPSSASKAAVRAQKSAPRLSAQQSSKGNAPSISPARWRSRLMAHLERHKRYPSSSRARREQGVAYVRFRIDSRGNVLSVSLARSSGFSALDREVVAMVRRASPVPAPPPGVQRTITAPVRFNVR